MFVDKVKVQVSAGKGGDGYISFRNEKFVDHGGPDGGDGGDGGDVIVEASNNQNTLAAFRYNKLITADEGAKGFKQKKHGKSADDLIVKLPLGTIVYDSDGHVRADLQTVGQRAVIAYGGKGGFGNAHFTSSTRQAPKFAEKGEEGEAYEAVFEIKLIAEVGLVGLPNAGKSTLLSVVTNARPEIANYPFTTLTPNLGVVDLDEGRSMLLADIPGLIEGASEGKGLGDDFLRHIERTKVLAHLVDAYSDHVAEDYRVIRKELELYSKKIAKLPEVVLLTQIDGLDQEIIDMQTEELRKVVKKNTKIMCLSSIAKVGLKEAMNEIYSIVHKVRQKAKKQEEDSVPVISPNFGELEWSVSEIEAGKYLVKGRKLERFAMRTDTENDEAVRRLRDILRKKGVMHELKKLGATSGSEIFFGVGRKTKITL